MSAFIAVSSPPPMQYPRIIAITGFSIDRHAPHDACSAASYSARASTAVRRVSNSEMSAPDTNAWSPAPRTTTTCTSGSMVNASRMRGTARCMSYDIAL